MCQVVTHKRLKTRKIICHYLLPPKVVAAYERWSFTRGSTHRDWEKCGVLDRWSLMGGGCLQEVVAHGGLTHCMCGVL